jgi:hypothetical protein
VQTDLQTQFAKKHGFAHLGADLLQRPNAQAVPAPIVLRGVDLPVPQNQL